MKRRILVVDDEPDIRLLLGLTLERAGYHVIEAATGEAATGAVSGGGVDLVLLDLNLPGISGIEVLEAWSRARVTPELPVLMLTADARPGIKERARELGAGGFLTKPIAPAELVAEIERALGHDNAPPATVEGP